MRKITIHFPSSHRTLSILVGVTGFLLTPLMVWGADFVPLAGLPQIAPNAGGGLAGYLNQLYVFLIIVGCIIAAIRISVAGAEYAFTEIVTDKAEAKKHILGVLTGLGILLLPYLVLNTIYPALTNLDILRSAGTLKSTINQTPAGNTVTSGISTLDATTNEINQLKNACGGSGSLVYGNNTMCCSETSYSGPYKCSGEQRPTDTNNSLGMDTLRVYGSIDEINDQVAAQSGLIRTEYGSDLKYKNLMPGNLSVSAATSQCTTVLSGSKPVFFKVTTPNANTPLNYVVCVK